VGNRKAANDDSSGHPRNPDAPAPVVGRDRPAVTPCGGHDRHPPGGRRCHYRGTGGAVSRHRTGRRPHHPVTTGGAGPLARASTVLARLVVQFSGGGGRPPPRRPCPARWRGPGFFPGGRGDRCNRWPTDLSQRGPVRPGRGSHPRELTHSNSWRSTPGQTLIAPFGLRCAVSGERRWHTVLRSNANRVCAHPSRPWAAPGAAAGTLGEVRVLVCRARSCGCHCPFSAATLTSPSG